MKRSVPIVPTFIVLIACAIMVRLGFWQIARLHQKEAMLAQYAAAEADRSVHRWPDGDKPPLPYSLVSATCAKVSRIAPQAGQNASHQAGWAQVAECAMAGGGTARVVLGWAAQPASVTWSGGAVTGTFVQRDKGGPVIFAEPPLAGLQPNARPDPRDIPNNHLAYAVQWFAFAGVALVIYVLAQRKRLLG